MKPVLVWIKTELKSFSFPWAPACSPHLFFFSLKYNPGLKMTQHPQIVFEVECEKHLQS